MQYLSRIVTLITFTCIFSTACKEFDENEAHNMQDIQVIGSHNSYKIAIEDSLWQYLYQLDSIGALSLQYEHPPLTEQLELGLRNLELDVFHDPLSGHFSAPKGLEIVKKNGSNSHAF